MIHDTIKGRIKRWLGAARTWPFPTDELPDETGEILKPNEIDVHDLVRRILDAGVLEGTSSDEPDSRYELPTNVVLIEVENELTLWIEQNPGSNPFIKLSVRFPFKKGTSLDARRALINRINYSRWVIRARFLHDGNQEITKMMVIEYFYPITGGVWVPQFLKTVKLFSDMVRDSVVELDEDDCIPSDASEIEWGE